MKSGNRIGFSLAWLVVIHCAVVFAGLFAPSDPEKQDRDHPYAPPMRVRFIDAAGKVHLRPFVYALKTRADDPGSYEEDRSRILPLQFLVREEEKTGTGAMPALRPIAVPPPDHLHLLGTDGFGRDQLSRLLFGGRMSLFSGLFAAFLSLCIGLGLGAIAGFYGGWLDEIVMSGTELILALPWLYCLLALRAFLPLHITPAQTFLMLILVMGLRGWARPARLIRGVVLSAKESDYVLAARGFGAGGPYLLTRHILPSTLGILVTQAALMVPQFILAEVTLSFLGLGVGEPAPTWGNMLANLQHYRVLVSCWWMFIPGVLLVPIFLSYHSLANALHERFSLRSGSEAYHPGY